MKIIIATVINLLAWIFVVINILVIFFLSAEVEDLWVRLLFISSMVIQIPFFYTHLKSILRQLTIVDKQMPTESLLLVGFVLTSISNLIVSISYDKCAGVFYSYFGFFLSVVIVGWILWISSLFFNRDFPNDYRLKFTLILYFLGIFISLSNILSITIGIYDKANDHMTLYYDNITTSVKNGNPYLPLKNNVFICDKDTILINSLNKWIWFDEGSSLIKIKDTGEKDYIIQKRICMIKEKPEKYGYDKKLSNIPEAMQQANFKYLNCLVKLLDSISTTGFNRMRISLIGHTDNEPLSEKGTRYKSNYELSLSRIQAVQQYLQDNISECNIEWSLIPRSNENYFQFTQKNIPPDYCVDRRSVEIYLEYIPNHYSANMMKSYKVKNNFTLIDYAYFMMYTITTTGYGDIKPVDSYIKFVVSIANIYELIFVVVFFNVLLSRKNEMA